MNDELVVTVFVLFSEISHEVSALGKQEVAHTSTKRDGQEQPAIVGHGYEHEEVGISHLHHMEGRLQQVHANTDGVVLESAMEKLQSTTTLRLQAFHHGLRGTLCSVCALSSVQCLQL